MAEPARSLTLHSSWRGLATSALGALVLLVAGIVGVTSGGWRFFPTALLVAGVVLIIVVLVDLPVATRFDADGLHRRAALRTHHMPWDQVRAITRTRPGILRGLRGLRVGGLTAVVGRRRYLLVDRAESLDEYQELFSLVDGLGHDVGIERVLPPDTEIPPTWLYRRSKWAPESARRR